MNVVAFDWSGVAVAIVAGVFSILNTVILAGFYFYIKPPSNGRFGLRGGSLGRMLEETHAGTHVAVAAVAGLEEDTNGKTTHPPLYEAHK